MALEKKGGTNCGRNMWAVGDLLKLGTITKWMKCTAMAQSEWNVQSWKLIQHW